ncbi:hypothetical protein D3C87_1720980 [compost metagenome]
MISRYIAAKTITVCCSASSEKRSLATDSIARILKKIIRISRDTANPTPIPRSMDPKYRIRFSALNSLKIFPFVSPIS